MTGRIQGAVLAAATMWAGTASAQGAIEVSESVSLPGAPAEVWSRVGGFCAIADWHPAVTSCDQAEQDGVTIRTLELDGGGVLSEERLEEGETSYAYAILEGPLPVASYRSEIAAEPEGEGTRITWTGSFDAAGATDAEAEAAIRGIYRSGLDAIAASEG